MTDHDQPRLDPLAEVINLIAAPIASGIRSIEQFRRGIDELFRTIDNVNRTMSTLNEAAARVDRLMADVEEPIRAILPQVTRTVKAADELLDVVGAPARLVAPNLVQIADTLGSPAFTSLPVQIGEFLRVMGDLSHRLGPLVQFAESAGGMFGLRLGGSRAAVAPAAIHAPSAASPVPTEARRTPGESAPRPAARKASKPVTETATRKATKKATRKAATGAPAKRPAAKKAAARRAAR